MPWQELGESSQADISLDADGYVHLTRVFKVWDVDRPSFYSHLDTITQVGGNATLPQYGHQIAVKLPNGAYGPFLTNNNGEVVGESVQANAILHQWRLQPSTAAVFFAIADYSNDPRLVPGGIHYRAEQQQAMVSIPYLRRSSIAVGPALSYGYLETAAQIPMGVESIAHSTVFPRSRLKEAEAIIADKVNQLHQLPIKIDGSPCLYLGADIAMRGPQWLDITHRWQWQGGVDRVYNRDSGLNYRYFNKTGGEFSPSENFIYFPKRIIPANPSTFIQFYYLLPPYHEVNMMIDYETQAGGIKVPTPVWFYRMPYRAEASDIIAWKSLPGSKNFIWGGGLG